MRYTFANCTLDIDAMRLDVDGAPVPLQPQVLDVLRLLIEERERVVPKQELLEGVWGHTFVTESALTSRIKSARQAIGDDGKAQRLIRTVHGRGYQFVGEVIESPTDMEPDATGAARRQLPRFGSELIGRETDVAAVLDHLERSRLVTVVGPGGVGKTRLAVAAAERSATDAVFVDLTSVRDPELVLTQISSAIGLNTNESVVRESLVEYLSGRTLLLVIDNAEHVIGAAADIGDLARSVADLTVLVTSRERLRVRGEQVYHLDPLDLDGDLHAGPGASAAVALFEQHARAIDPDFDMERWGPSAERICRAVEGLPLAIELAAAQTGTLPTDMLASRLGERLRSSSSSLRDAPTRQRTMADTIEWSLQLVTVPELRLFGRLGVFAGPVCIEAVEAVCRDDQLPDPVDLLARLVDRSLVRRVIGADGVVRFVMLHLLRERAAELLDDDPAVEEIERRHREYVASELWRIDDDHWSGVVSSWIDQVSALRAEARRAFGSAVSRADWETAGRIAGSLSTYHHREGGLGEGRSWLAALEAHHHELSDAVLGRVLLGQGLLAWDHDEQQSARTSWERALVVMQRIGDEVRSAYVLASLAIAHLDEPGEHARCRLLIDRGVALARRSAEPLLVAEVLNIAGEFARATGDDASARVCYEESVDLATELHDQTLASIALANLSYLACHQGDFEAGRTIGRRALEMCWAHKRRQLAAWSVGELAGPAAGLGEHELAARLIGASRRALEQLGGRIYPADKLEHERTASAVRAALGSERYRELSAQGRTLSLDESIALALGAPTWPPGSGGRSTPRTQQTGSNSG